MKFRLPESPSERFQAAFLAFVYFDGNARLAAHHAFGWVARTGAFSVGTVSDSVTVRMFL